MDSDFFTGMQIWFAAAAVADDQNVRLLCLVVALVAMLLGNMNKRHSGDSRP